MAAGPTPNPPQAVHVQTISVGGAGSIQEIRPPVGGIAGVGSVSVTPPTFLERWGVVFVSVAGAWMLLVAACILHYFMAHSLPAPIQAQGMTNVQYKEAIELHKTISDQFRDSCNFIFDLLVTKTVLPLVTLLLGYLFGSKKS